MVQTYYGPNERHTFTEKSRYKETRRLPKTRRRQLRWNDWVKRGLRMAEEDGTWREKANNRDQWKNEEGHS